MNKFIKYFLKYVLGYALFLLIVFLISSAKPKADIIEYKFIDYVSNSATIKETNFAADETYTYTRDYVLFNGSDKFFAFNYCATGPFDFSFPNDIEGVTSVVGYSTGGQCYVQGYEGYNYTLYFMAKQINDAGNGNLSIMFNTSVHNRASYTVFINVLSLTSVSSIPAGVQIPTYDGEFSTLNTKIDTVEQAVEEVKKAQNENLNEQKKTNDLLTDETAPDLDIDSMVGWLPAGPVDSILNLPLTFFNSLTTNLSKTCKPINVPLPYLDKNYELPCIKQLFAKFGNFSTIWNLYVGTFVSVLILYSYLLRLYKYIDETLKFRDSSDISSWGGV